MGNDCSLGRQFTISNVMLQRAFLEGKIKQVMNELFNEEITDDFSKFSTEKWDSFLHLDLVVKLEELFDLSFTPDEIGKMDSYKEIVNIINEKI